MRVARVRLHLFRGYTEQVILPAGHAVVVGEPRAGRSDLITGLRRVLDPRSWSRTPDLSDIHRPAPDPGVDAADGETVVEVTLAGLGGDLEQDLDDRLELVNLATGLPAAEEEAADAVLGVRVRYRIFFDEVLADYDHAWEYVATGAPVPRLERDMLAAVVIGPGTPLQLRSGGVFRGMVADRDADAVRAAIEELSGDVTAAAGKLAGVKVIQEVLARILDGGTAHVLGMPAAEPSGRIGFTADDGTADTLLRRMQPTLDLDEAGPLPLYAHGSTAKGVLAVAEAMTAADIAGAVVLADDFGDDLDAASAEFLAATVRRASGRPPVRRPALQLWRLTALQEMGRSRDHRPAPRPRRTAGDRRQTCRSRHRPRRRLLRRDTQGRLGPRHALDAAHPRGLLAAGLARCRSRTHLRRRQPGNGRTARTRHATSHTRPRGSSQARPGPRRTPRSVMRTPARRSVSWRRLLAEPMQAGRKGVSQDRSAECSRAFCPGR